MSNILKDKESDEENELAKGYYVQSKRAFCTFMER